MFLACTHQSISGLIEPYHHLVPISVLARRYHHRTPKAVLPQMFKDSRNRRGKNWKKTVETRGATRPGETGNQLDSFDVLQGASSDSSASEISFMVALSTSAVHVAR